ncbi:MAG: neuraminidase-like domain-containing protein [Myxococcota bacterium]
MRGRTLGAPETVLATVIPSPDATWSTSLAVPASARLSFRVVAEAEIPAGSDHWEEVGTSALVPNAPSFVPIHLSIVDDRLRTRSEAGRLAAVDTALAAAGITDPDLVTAADIELLAGTLSVPQPNVTRRLAAAKLKKVFETIPEAPVIALDVYYALVRMKFPLRPRGFARRAAVPKDDLRALRRAVELGILRASILEQPGLDALIGKLQSLLSVYDQWFGAGDSLVTVMRAVSTPTELTDAQLNVFVERWRVRTSPVRFWRDLETSPPSTPPWGPLATPAAERAMAILTVTGRHLPTARAFQTAHPKAPAHRMAGIGLSGWQALIAGIPGPELPRWIRGPTTAARRTAWADAVYRAAERRYPWAALRGDMLRELSVDPTLGTTDFTALAAFLGAQRKTDWTSETPVEFDLPTAHIPAFEPAPSALVVEQLEALQRLLAVTPIRDAWTAMRTLWLAGFRSAGDVSRIGQQRFFFRLEKASPGAVEMDLALAIWRRGRRRSQRAANAWRAGNPVRGVGQGLFAGSGANHVEIKPAAITEVQKLYTQALCGCVHCQSVLSPSAYFVDMLFWLDARQALDPLLAVRPDLELLQLGCENTETALPYADVLIEVLEQIVAGESLAALPHVTLGTTPALLAYPEYAERSTATAAYDLLEQVVWPRVLPYHLALDEVQTYLAKAGVPHVDLIDAFNGLVSTPVTDIERAVLLLGGTTVGAQRLLEGGGANPEEWWGFPVPTAGYGDVLVEVPELLSRGQIDRFDVVLDLMRTRYLNADARLGVVLSPDAPADADACSIEHLRLLRDVSTTPAPDFVRPQPWTFVRMGAFLRLLDWTGWTSLTLDKALYALGVTGGAHRSGAPNPGVDLTGARLRGLQAIDGLMFHTGLPAEEICSWWTGIDTYLDRQNRAGELVVPLYDQRFLDPSVASAEETPFALNVDRNELATTASTSLVDTEPAALASALRVDIGQLQATAAYVDGRISPGLSTNLASLWHLFRWTSLSRAAGLTIDQVDQWIRMTGLDPFATGASDPTFALTWLLALGDLRSHELSVGAVGWIFGHAASEVAAFAPTDTANEAVLLQLQTDLVAVRAELSATAADEPTVRAALDELGLDDATIESIVAVLVWETDQSASYAALDALEPWVTDLAALKSDLPIAAPPGDPLTPEVVAARMSTLFVHLQAATLIRRQRDLVIGALEAAFPAMTRGHLDLLDAVGFSGLADFADPLAALHLTSAGSPGWSLETSVGVSTADAAPAHEALHLVAKLAYLASVLQLDAVSLAEWLTQAAAVGAPALTALPVTEDLDALAGLWDTLKPALRWFDLDRRFQDPEPTASAIRDTLRAGSARVALAMVGERAGWDLGIVLPLVEAMGLRTADLTVPGGDVPLTASITVDGVLIEGTAAAATAGEVLTAMGLAVTAAALPWLAAQTLDASGGVAASPQDAVTLRLSTTDPLHTPFDVTTSTFAVDHALHEVGPFGNLLDRWELLASGGLDLATALSFVTADPSRVHAADARRVARGRFPSDASWSPVGRPLRDEIRRRQQAALYAKVRSMPGAPKTDAEFYARYFIDPQMDPCMLTTRLVLATGSVQTYVNRVLLGLVADAEGKLVQLAPEDEAEWQGWRGSYRMWEAARKVFMFPENWLEPSLRAERSPEFRAFEEKLLSEGLNADSAEAAMKAYLVDILQYGNPKLACMTESASGDLHFLARTGSAQDNLFYRIGTKIDARRWRWLAWEPLPFPVPTTPQSRLAMYVLGDAVLVMWATVTTLDDGTTVSSTIRVEFAVRDGSDWSAPQKCHEYVVSGHSITALHLLVYEHTAEVGGEISSGLYATLEHTTENVAVQGFLHGAALMKWSPTLRTFVADVDTTAALQATTLKTRGSSGDDEYTGGQPQEPSADGGEYVYSFIPSLDARFQTLAFGQNPPAGTVATLWGATRTSRLGDGDTAPIEMEQAEVIRYDHDSGRGEILIPPNFADWGSDAPFAVQHSSRSYLVLKG